MAARVSNRRRMDHPLLSVRSQPPCQADKLLHPHLYASYRETGAEKGGGGEILRKSGVPVFRGRSPRTGVALDGPSTYRPKVVPRAHLRYEQACSQTPPQHRTSSPNIDIDIQPHIDPHNTRHIFLFEVFIVIDGSTFFL